MDRSVWNSRLFFFFKQKTAYEIRNCDWSSDVCSPDLRKRDRETERERDRQREREREREREGEREREREREERKSGV